MAWYWVDIAIVAVILLSVITGLFRGFVKELIACCVWVFAFWFAYNYGSMLTPWVGKYIHDKTLLTIVEFIIILFMSLILGGLINAVIGFLMHRSGLSGTDRLLGMCFGFVRGVFIVTVLMVGIRMTGMPFEQYSKESKLYAHFNPLVAWFSSYMPEFIDRVKKLDSNDHRAIGKAHDA